MSLPRKRCVNADVKKVENSRLIEHILTSPERLVDREAILSWNAAILLGELLHRHFAQLFQVKDTWSVDEVQALLHDQQ